VIELILTTLLGLGVGVSLSRYRLERLARRIALRQSIPLMPNIYGREQLVYVVERLEQTLKSVSDRDAARLNILERLPNPLLMLDEHLYIVRANNAARDLFQQNHMGGKSVERFMPQPTLLGVMRECIVNQTSSRQDYEYIANRRFQILFEPIPANPMGQTRLVLVFQDVTTLEQLLIRNRDYVANASHELKTPLTSIQGYLEILRGEAGEDKTLRQEFLQTISAQTRQMIKLVQALLSLSKIQHNQVPVTDTVNLMTLIQQQTKDLEHLAAMREMRFEILDVGEFWVRGDEADLMQLCQNILDNAIKYGRAQTAITITLKHFDAQIVWETKNLGSGIPVDEIPRLTERFYRGQYARNHGIEGTGLGLSIVSQIVKRHHGTLRLESETGGCTKVTVCLPALHQVPQNV
jgi:two-component system, OmpR family, phosphate regulon sensor histidine kinase PhoR